MLLWHGESGCGNVPSCFDPFDFQQGPDEEICGARASISNIELHNSLSKHGLNYFEPNIAQAQSMEGQSGAQGYAPQSHPMGKSSGTALPPSNSAIAPGSTTTPTHTDAGPGFSSRSLNDDHPSTQIPPLPQQQQAEENWSYSLAESMISQQNCSPSQIGHPPDEHALSQSPGETHNMATYSSAIKLLVSNNVAGSIIGRAGQTISELQSESSARIKLSQTGDYYPGTQDRVCLVQGQLDNVKFAVRLLLERFYMLQEQQHSQHLSWQPKPNEPPPTGFDFIVRLLVPSSSCGMIIGKSGSNIKHMEESSGVSSVRLSPKETGDPPSPTAAIMSGTSERIVTLTGPTLESCIICLHIIIDGMMAHHEICRYANMTTSYSRVVMHGSFGGVSAGPIPGRPLFMVPSGATQESPTWENGSPYNQFGQNKRSISSPDLAGQMLWDHRVPPRMPQEGLTTSLSRPLPASDPTQPPYSTVFTEGSLSYAHEVPAMMSSPVRGPPPNSNASSVYLLDQGCMPNSISAPDLLALQLQDSLRINTAPSSPGLDYTHFASQMPQPTPPGFTAQVLVPDTMIGSILGRGGRTLNELQMHSNTRIRISQRGEYVPGTRNRIVTIRGPTAHSVSLAQYLMSQRMVLPPTASYSPQVAPFHPPTMQPQLSSHQRLPLHPSQQPQLAHRHDIHTPHYHGASVDSSVQGPESHGQYPSAALSRNSSNKELSHS